ncbi:hypothetical protein [Ensifer sp. B1-9]|uniref:hypothetical protein n=1 Tax=Ensifer sp. B1-9 TaxID=3141455 RepID=UPI003D1C608F
MDIYLIELLVAFLFSYLGLLLTKPRGVPVKQLSRMHLPPFANFFRVLSITTYLMMMTMFFVGMLLRRYPEAVS